MIYTITLNPSIDYNISVENFKEETVNIMKSNNKYPGGKGINVSQVLKNLGISSKAITFLGGFTGDYIRKELEKKGIELDFIEIEEDTRINIKIKDGNKETEINGNSPFIDENRYLKLKNKLKLLKKEDIIILSGSIPSSLSKFTYSELMKELPLGVKIVVDARGTSLLRAIEEKPYLIKPNNHELEEVFENKLQSLEDIIEAAKKLNELGAENVIVSMAAKGALLVNKNEILYANAPKGKVLNSVGAGDSLVAGFMGAISLGENIESAFKMGVASGSASAFSKELCKKDDVVRLLKEIEIKKI